MPILNVYENIILNVCENSEEAFAQHFHSAMQKFRSCRILSLISKELLTTLLYNHNFIILI